MRYPVLGATFQPRGGIAKHDHVAWAFARGAHARGVDLIQGCEVTGILIHRGCVAGVETTHGCIEAPRVALAAALELFPVFARADAPRSWAGSVDVTPDASPILGPTPLEGLFVNCGWGTGGLKATPGAGRMYAETIATGETHPLAEPFALERFALGAHVGGHRAAAVAH